MIEGIVWSMHMNCHCLELFSVNSLRLEWICFRFLLWAVAPGLSVAKSRCCPVVAWVKVLRPEVHSVHEHFSADGESRRGKKKSGALLSSSEKAGQIRLELTGRDIQLDWACQSRASIRICTCPSLASFSKARTLSATSDLIPLTYSIYYSNFLRHF